MKHAAAEVTRGANRGFRETCDEDKEAEDFAPSLRAMLGSGPRMNPCGRNAHLKCGNIHELAHFF